MGQEANCTVRYEGKTANGRALLESSELLFRGDLRLKIPFSSIHSVHAVDGELRLHTKDGMAIFELGPKAEKWRERILHPKSLLEKLGVKAGNNVSLVGKFPADFLASLEKQGAKTIAEKVTKAPEWIFLAADSRRDLEKVKGVAARMEGATALWLVYPKGVKAIPENDVREAALKAGLTDVKVASFSATHTALKFVIPKAKR